MRHKYYDCFRSKENKFSSLFLFPINSDNKSNAFSHQIFMFFHTSSKFKILVDIIMLECNDIPNDDTSRDFIDHTVHSTILMTRYDWMLLTILMPRYDWVLLTILAILFQQIISLVPKTVKSNISFNFHGRMWQILKKKKMST